MRGITNSTLNQSISSVPYTDGYKPFPPTVGQDFVLIEPSSPVRAARTLQKINRLEDRGELGTVLRFGHPLRIRGVGPSYSSIELPSHGNDPIPQRPKEFHLGLENHKLRVPVPPDLAEHYLRRPDAVVVAREGLEVEDLTTGTRQRLLFGSRIHDLRTNELSQCRFSIGAEQFRREYLMIGSLDALGAAKNEGVTLVELLRRVSAFSGMNFAWGHIGTESSDAAGWIQSLLGSFGVHVPHNTLRMDAHLRATGDIGRELTSLSELTTGDLIFLGLKGKPIDYMGMIEQGENGRLAMRHCRGKGAWQGNYLNRTSEIFSETQIEGFPSHELKAAWRVINLV